LSQFWVRIPEISVFLGEFFVSGSEICDLLPGLCDIGDLGVVVVDCLAKKRIRDRRTDNFGSFEAD
jgi:hypothetical protein